MKEVKGWTTDQNHYHTRDTKFFKIDEIYFLLKTLIAQDLEKNKEEKQDILHTIIIFEGKFEAICKK